MNIDLFALIFVLSIVGAIALAYGYSAILGIIYGIVMLISIVKFGAKIGDFLLKKDFESFLLSRKLGRSVSVLLSENYRSLHKGFSGYIRVAMSITWVSFGISLLVLRFALPQIVSFVGTQREVGAVLVLAVIVVGIFSALLAPLSIPYWVIASSRVRILNKKKIVLDFPGSLLRKIFRMFGAGNVVVLAYFLYSAVEVADDVVVGIIVGLQIAVFLYGALGLGGIIASVIIGLKYPNIFNDALINFEEKYKEVSISGDEFIGVLKEAVKLAEKVEAEGMDITQGETKEGRVEELPGEEAPEESGLNEEGKP